MESVVAIGDGANDLDMLEVAGLGIAYNAKALVQEAADTTVNVPYLDAIMYLLGISREEIEALDARARRRHPRPARSESRSAQLGGRRGTPTRRAEARSSSAQAPVTSKTASAPVGKPVAICAAGLLVAGAVVEELGQVGHRSGCGRPRPAPSTSSAVSRTRSSAVSGPAA